MIAEIIFILIFTLILVILLAPVGGYGTYRTRVWGRRVPARREDDAEAIGLGMTMFFFFFLIFPLLLASNYWITPYGPTFMDVSWVPIIVTGILLALLIAAISPRRPRPGVREITAPEEAAGAGAAALFGLMFFLLLIGAFSLVIIALI
ncbi:MAG: hypothetical protein ACLFVC_06230 [Opitutales bacterium]